MRMSLCVTPTRRPSDGMSWTMVLLSSRVSTFFAKLGAFCSCSSFCRTDPFNGAFEQHTIGFLNSTSLQPISAGRAAVLVVASPSPPARDLDPLQAHADCPPFQRLATVGSLRLGRSPPQRPWQAGVYNPRRLANE
jgi:hypothetical protein